MSSAVQPTVGVRAPSLLPQLARHEIRRYLRHPLFWVGVVLTAATCFSAPDPRSSTLFNVIAPATGLGLFGLLIMVGMVRSSDQAAAAAGGVSVPESTRTLALASTVVVPFTAALIWFGWAAWVYRTTTVDPSGLPFGGVGDAWAYAVLFDLGVISAVGGPLLGLVIGRWVHRRGAAAISVVVLVLVTILMQGIFEPLRTIRLVMPWTYFGGTLNTGADPERMLILVGSPQWYGVYLLLLCALAVLFAVFHDREADRRRVRVALVVTLVLAIAATVTAMKTGVPATMVNPVPAPL